MKGLNLGTAVYSLVTSLIFLIAPLFTLGAIISDVASEQGSGDSTSVDMFFRFLAVVMIATAVVLLAKDRVSSTAGKVLVLIAGGLVLVFSSLFGFVAGVVGIIGASLLLASNKKYAYKKVSE